jgi:predicted acylesterase/phospholipase RssA
MLNCCAAYVDEQEKALEFVRDSSELSNEEKKRFFKSATTNLGISALCLSGGASFGYCARPARVVLLLMAFTPHPHTDHFGVVKAFLEEGLLPRVITGTSAGGLIASLVCTRTDDELRKLLVPELAHRITACEDPFSVWAKRAWKTGARFDSVMWARKVSGLDESARTVMLNV